MASSSSGMAPPVKPVSSKVDLRAETAEDAEDVERLYRRVLRSFYDDKFVVIGEQVLRWGMLPADVLANRLGIQAKDLAALAAKLVDDKMLCHFKRTEKREGYTESKMQPRNYYHFHAPLFLAMLKFRLHHLRLKLDSSIVSSSYTTSFVCPQCKFSYSTLDVAHLLDLSTNSLRCERPGCGAELQEDEEEGEETLRGKERMRRFNEQCAGMIKSLESLERVELKSIDPVAFLADPANHTWKSLRSDTNTRQLEEKQWFDLPDSQATSMSEMAAPTVSLTDATSSAAALQAAREEAERQRKENAIPEWLGKSTVSGEETALGIKERRNQELRDERVGRRGQGDSANATAGGAEGDTEAGGEEDYYAQYAQMQAQQLEAEEAERGRRQANAPPSGTASSSKRGRPVNGEAADGLEGERLVEKRVKREEQAGSGTDGGARGAVKEEEEEEEEPDLDEVA
ncbi:unnamed protein product [Parajaminaea phylloscopi]